MIASLATAYFSNFMKKLKNKCPHLFQCACTEVGVVSCLQQLRAHACAGSCWAKQTFYLCSVDCRLSFLDPRMGKRSSRLSRRALNLAMEHRSNFFPGLWPRRVLLCRGIFTYKAGPYLVAQEIFALAMGWSSATHNQTEGHGLLDCWVDKKDSFLWLDQFHDPRGILQRHKALWDWTGHINHVLA